jgi:hypothetical protein
MALVVTILIYIRETTGSILVRRAPKILRHFIFSLVIPGLFLKLGHDHLRFIIRTAYLPTKSPQVGQNFLVSDISY